VKQEVVTAYPSHACPCTVWAWPNNAQHRVWPRPGGSCRCTRIRGTLVPRTCARAVVASRGRVCRVTAKDRFKIIEKPFKSRICKPKRQGPGKRSLPGSLPKARQDTCRGKVSGAARYQARQGIRRGKVLAATRCDAVLLCCRSSASASMAFWGLPGMRGGVLCGRRRTVASGADGTSTFPMSKTPRYMYLDS
jgi:hypothetical protein